MTAITVTKWGSTFERRDDGWYRNGTALSRAESAEMDAVFPIMAERRTHPRVADWDDKLRDDRRLT